MKCAILSIALVLASAVAVQAQDWAKERIEKSPRHHEWVTLKHDNREVKCYITFPEVKEKATAVLVIHEIFGLTDWVRSVTDQLAEAGYIAISPDFLSGMAPKGGGSEEVGSDGATRLVSGLPAPQVTADLEACYKYLSELSSCNGKIVVSGFCWGGQQSFRFATNNKNVKAAFVFYGNPPATGDLPKIDCPVYGFYGGNDNRVTGTVAGTTTQMKDAKKTFEQVTYEGAGHGFMRAGEDPNDNAMNATAKAANKKAHDEGWKKWKELLAKI